MKNHFKYLFFLLVFAFTTNASFAQKKKTKESKYDVQGPFYNGLARVKQNKKWGFIDTTGSMIIPLKYDQVENFSDGIAKVRIDHRWGLVNTSGTQIIKPMFDFIYDFENGKAKVTAGGKTAYIDKNGNLLK